jgi:hypothetical protein
MNSIACGAFGALTLSVGFNFHGLANSLSLCDVTSFPRDLSQIANDFATDLTIQLVAEARQITNSLHLAQYL